jgi:hypothetical protein
MLGGAGYRAARGVTAPGREGERAGKPVRRPRCGVRGARCERARRRVPRTAHHTVPQHRSLVRVRAPLQGEGDSRLLYLRPPARALSAGMRAVRDAYSRAARHVDVGTDRARCRDHRDQTPDQQTLRVGVRALDGRGFLRGGYSKRDRDVDAPTFIIESVTKMADMAFSGHIGVAITLGDSAEVNSEVLRDVRAVIETHSTPSTAAPALEVRWRDGNGGTKLRSKSLRVPASHAALSELRALLGPDRVHLVRAG